MGEPQNSAAMTLDLRGYRCPVPVLRLTAALRDLLPDMQVTVFADDPVAAVDIPQFCREAGHGFARIAADPPDCVFLVTRGGKPA